MINNTNSQHSRNKIIRYGLVILSVVLFVISLFCPAFFIDRVDRDAYSNSFYLLIIGWMGLLGGAIIPFLIWLANPLYIFSILLVTSREKAGVLFALIPVVLAVVFANLDTIITSESGASSRITELGSGYILWLLSFIVLFAASIFNLFDKSPE
ncbi:hypothetical protein [Soonwooa sp.]|uniref:hypothetical protein n=1 Tax=Soonwooa sp. TaxID=1938592 RepID=UPI00260EF3E6|nr:hypothetical protein [Soonwooa sp.]